MSDENFERCIAILVIAVCFAAVVIVLGIAALVWKAVIQ